MDSSTKIYYSDWVIMTVKMLLLIGVLVSMCGIAGAQQLGEAVFVELHERLNPKNEMWKLIPWKTDLLQAQELAAKSRKPLFIWAMDGHPLGCT